MTKKKILHVQLFPILSGAQRVTLDEIDRLDPSEFESVVICNGYGALTEALEKRDIRYILIRSLKREINPFWDIIAFFKLLFVILSEKPDIVHTHSAKPGVLGRLAAKLAVHPVIFHTVHGFAFAHEKNVFIIAIYRLCEKICGIFTNVLIVLHEQDHRLAELVGVNSDKILILQNGVDLERFYISTRKKDRLANLRQNEFKDPLFRIGFVGRLTRQKNPELIIEVASRLCVVHQNLKFIIVGDGELRGDLEKKVVDSNLSAFIDFLGWDADVHNQFQDLDLMVLPSLWEGMPLTLLEAMACGVGAIASDINGNKHLIENETNGFLFTSNDVDQLEIIIKKILGNKSVFIRCVENALISVTQNYDINKRIEKLSLQYTKAVSARKLR